jgi:hypothetical protein
VQQGLDHAAFPNAAMAIAGDHLREFSFERGDARDKLLLFGEAWAGDGVGDFVLAFSRFWPPSLRPRPSAFW